MENREIYFKIRLINWYELNKRDLPWRKTNDPYKIWLSEVILQQTRVDQGISYYDKFVNKYPTISDLAAANEDQVLKDWEGLGYYSRARNLLHTAKNLNENYKKEFPKTYNEIINLKGIGTYTAAAISSFAYNQAHAVVDGNVYRVLSRIFGISHPIDTNKGKKEFNTLANQLIDKEQAGIYNQAIMEFGAIHCLPKNPKCDSCPFADNCYAYSKNSIDKFPVKSKKIKQRIRYFDYLVISNKNNLLLNKRGKDDIWAGLYDFPLIEHDSQLSEQELMKSNEWTRFFKNIPFNIISRSNTLKHILSHQKIFARFIELEIDDLRKFNQNKYLIINKNNLNNYPLPKLLTNYIYDR